MRDQPRAWAWHRTAIVVLSGLPGCLLSAEQPDAAPVERPAPAFSASADEPISQLRWLAGCWQRRSGERWVEEQWMAPRGGLMLGVSRTVDGGNAREYEHTLIRSEGDRLVFVAQPSGQQRASFTSIELTATRVVFENRAHDFPQRVIYEIKADGTLAARIEGDRDGRVVTVEFPYERVDCSEAAGVRP